MRFPPNIQKLEREKRLKKKQEICELTSPLRIKRTMKPLVLTKPITIPQSMERKPEKRGEVLLEISMEEPNDPPESMER